MGLGQSQLAHAVGQRPGDELEVGVARADAQRFGVLVVRGVELIAHQEGLGVRDAQLLILGVLAGGLCEDDLGFGQILLLYVVSCGVEECVNECGVLVEGRLGGGRGRGGGPPHEGRGCQKADQQRQDEQHRGRV